MSDTLSLYWFSILTAMVFAAILSYLGIHLVTRREGLILLPQSQMTAIGILLGILIFDEVEGIIVLSFSVLTTFISGILLSKFLKKMKYSKETTLLVLFFILTGLGHFMIRFFPTLESHFHHGFEGDIVTASSLSLRIALGILILCGSLLILRRNQDKAQSFQVALGSDVRSWVFPLIVALCLTLGVFLLGGSLTMSLMLVPTIILGRTSHSLKAHTLEVITTSIISAFIGFILSLFHTSFATTSSIVLMLPLISGLVRLLPAKLRIKS